MFKYFLGFEFHGSKRWLPAINHGYLQRVGDHVIFVFHIKLTWCVSRITLFFQRRALRQLPRAESSMVALQNHMSKAPALADLHTEH